MNSNLSCSQVCSKSNIYFYNNKCVSSCQEGTYLLADLVTCQSCSSMCATCFGIGTNCTTCSTQFLYNQNCVDSCPANYYVDNNKTCQPCSGNKCSLPPLSYSIQTSIGKNYTQNTYVIFNRPVNLSIS